jgi:hypothetical protein
MNSTLPLTAQFRFPIFLCAVVALMLIITGCSDRKQEMDCPTGLDVNTSKMDQEIRASYSAKQIKNRVVIRGTGELPAGYEAVFVQSPLRVYPPQYLLMRHRLNGNYPSVPQKFSVCVMFRADGPVDRVIVNDADGRHEIDVTR